MREWISVKDKLPDHGAGVIVTFINHDPESYYEHIKDKPQVAFACYSEAREMWFWWSAVAEDLISECGYACGDEIDEAIEIVAWMPKPEPPKDESR